MVNSVKRGLKLGTVTFNYSKNEIIHQDACKVCFRNLAVLGFNVAINNGKICPESLFKSTIFIMFGPREDLTINEIIHLQKYLNRGGKFIITGNYDKLSNINLLLKTYGIEFRSDYVFRTHRAKDYNHPCESFISDGVVNASVYSMAAEMDIIGDLPPPKPFSIIYAYGCTLNVTNTSMILLSTGSVCFPFNRPICAFYRDLDNDSRIVAVGSTMMFADYYIGKEQNLRLFHVLVKLLTEDVHLDIADIQCPDIADYATIPCISEWRNHPFCCLQELDDLPCDLSSLRRKELHQFDNRHFVKVLEAYGELNVEHKKLNTIKPRFESLLLPALPALIPPRFRDCTRPALELMDLDEFFVSASFALCRMTFKCTDSDLEYYITECGKILNIPKNTSAKGILFHVCNELVGFKKKIEHDALETETDVIGTN